MFDGLQDSSSGGAIYCSGSAIALGIVRCYFANCRATASGGAVYTDSIPMISMAQTSG
jgi:hypothetical protein